MTTDQPIPRSGALDVDKGDDSRITIRRFVDSGIQDAVDRAVARLASQGKNVAVMAVANKNEGGLAIMARIGDNWSIVAVGQKTWKDDGYKLQAAVKWSI